MAIHTPFEYINLSRHALENADSPGTYDLLGPEDPYAGATLVDGRMFFDRYFQWKRCVSPSSIDHSSNTHGNSSARANCASTSRASRPRILLNPPARHLLISIIPRRVSERRVTMPTLDPRLPLSEANIRGRVDSSCSQHIDDHEIRLSDPLLAKMASF